MCYGKTRTEHQLSPLSRRSLPLTLRCTPGAAKLVQTSDIPTTFPGSASLHTLALGSMTDIVHRGSHLTNAEIAAETVLRAAQPGDSLKELFSEADMAAFCETPQ